MISSILVKVVLISIDWSAKINSHIIVFDDESLYQPFA